MNRLSAMIAAAIVVAGCGSSGGDGPAVTAPPVASCSVSDQNQFVIDTIAEFYYWIDAINLVDAAAFSSPEATLDALRFDSLDRFSDIRDQAANDQFFSASQFIGVGLSSKTLGSQLFVSQVFDDGGAAAAGMARGDEILSINGRATSDIIDSGDSVSEAFGPNEQGNVVVLEFRKPGMATESATITKGPVTIDTVSAAQVIEINGQRVAYLNFRNFVEPSFAALADAFALFAAEGANELVVDMRYNGGGLVSVAERLASLIGGTGTAGRVLSQRIHNDANTNLNVTSTFEDPANAMNLTDVVIITTVASASATELVINALEPYLDVRLVGERTFGKPVGSYGFDFCEKTLVPISFATFNAADEGDYFDGIPVDCEAEDDLSRAFGDPLEASFAEALVVLDTGACSPVTTTQKIDPVVAEERRVALQRRSGLQTLINAH